MHAISLYFMLYNFCKIHKSLRVTPAMEAGISEKLWDISDIVALIPEEAPKKRRNYKKKFESGIILGQRKTLFLKPQPVLPLSLLSRD